MIGGIKLKKWRYAISTADDAPLSAPILLKGSIPENLKLAASLGYDAIELHTRPDEVYDYDEIRNSEATSGIKLAMIITGRLNTEGQCSLVDDAPYVVDAAMNCMRDYIDMAGKIGADIVIGWVKGNIPPGKKREIYMGRLARNLRALAQYASQHNVKLNLEVINRYEVNIFTTAEETMEFIETNKIDNLYVHLDTFHMGIDECDPIKAIHRCRGKLGYIHLADNTRQYPGSGLVDFKRILAALEEIDYDGWLSVECLPKPDEITAAKKAIRYMKEIEAMQ